MIDTHCHLDMCRDPDAAADNDLGVIAFEKETLEGFEGPTPSRSKELIGWPGIAEASALAGGREGGPEDEKIGQGHGQQGQVEPRVRDAQRA